MDFNEKLPGWQTEGSEPSDNLKGTGFLAGQRLPANIFNWIVHRLQACIDEIRNKLGKLSKSDVGLDKVDNTSDSEKSVKFASEAGVGRKVQYGLEIHLNGGRTEGTDLWTYDGSTSRSVNVTPEKIGAAKKDLSNVDDELFKQKVQDNCVLGTPTVTATSSDGVAYVATVDNVDSLTNGFEIIIIPNTKSTSTAITLDVNGLGAIPIRRPLSFSTFVATSIDADRTYFLSENTPCRLMYHANYTSGGIWLMADKQKTSAQDLYGVTPVESGGTGSSNAMEAQQELGLGTYTAQLEKIEDNVAYWNISIPALTELVIGTNITVKFNTDDANLCTSAKFNVNGLGEKNVLRRHSRGGITAFGMDLMQWQYTSQVYNFTLGYNGWVLDDLPKPSASDLEGVVPLSNGGTGAQSLGAVKDNLGIPTYIKITNNMPWDEYYACDYFIINLSNGTSITTTQHYKEEDVAFVSYAYAIAGEYGEKNMRYELEMFKEGDIANGASLNCHEFNINTGDISSPTVEYTSIIGVKFPPIEDVVILL